MTRNITINDVWERLGENACTFGDNRTIVMEDQAGHMAKVVAYAALTDIAEYYNKGWKPVWIGQKAKEKYTILLEKGEYYSVDSTVTFNCGAVYFKRCSDAQAVIDNPNFRKVLDTLYKD